MEGLTPMKLTCTHFRPERRSPCATGVDRDPDWCSGPSPHSNLHVFTHPQKTFANLHFSSWGGPFHLLLSRSSWMDALTPPEKR